LAVATTLNFSTAASAATVTECQTLITNLNIATNGTTFLSRSADRDHSNLIAKLAAAADKIDHNKLVDASMKLDDYSSKVTALLESRKPKIDPSDANELLAGAGEASTCVADLIAQAAE
jgi:hypothetical protein